MTERKKWNCKSCFDNCHVTTSKNPNEIYHCDEGVSDWIQERPIGEIKKVASLKQWKLVIPDKIAKQNAAIYNFWKSFDGKEIPNGLYKSIAFDLFPKDWLVEVKEPMTEAEALESNH